MRYKQITQNDTRQQSLPARQKSENVFTFVENFFVSAQDRGRARGLLRCLESGLYSRINALSHFVFYTDPKPFILLYFMRKLVDCLNICDNASTQLNKIYNKGLLVS